MQNKVAEKKFRLIIESDIYSCDIVINEKRILPFMQSVEKFMFNKVYSHYWRKKLRQKKNYKYLKFQIISL